MLRLPRSLPLLGSLVLFAAALGCAPEGADETSLEDVSARDALAESLPEGETLGTVFQGVGAAMNVPPDLLASIAWVETRLSMVEGDVEFEGQEARYGVMAIRESEIPKAAALIGVAEDAIKYDVAANIQAGAALLSAYADEEGTDRADLGDWAAVTARFSGIDLFQAQVAYVHEEVYATLRAGLSTEMVQFAPQQVTAKFPLMDQNLTPGPDYAASIYRKSPNQSTRPSGTSGKPQMVIIHTCEGSYSGCWGWLTNSDAGVSAHYVVNSTGSEVSQLVQESKKAWHIAATYDCSRNSSVSCNLNNVSGNSFTIGIEHAGYASQSSWSDGQLDASAKLVCDITKDNGIPQDKWHIVGHGQLQPWNRVDPGPNWPWTKYLDLVGTACGANPPPPPQDPADPQDPPADPADPGSPLTITVDSNNNANGADGKCEVSGNWTASNNVSGYHNTGYFWRKAGASSDAARFKVKLPSTKKVVVEAWWPAASDRSAAVPFVIVDAGGAQVGSVYVDQRKNGSKWATIGTYTLPAGWNEILVSRWTDSSGVIIADAVRVREVP
jgi:N-acetyl-anhydromuramyl-L-alanine amidase AmpD